VVSKDQVEGRPLMVVNDLDIAQDGTIYFSDSSQFSLQNTLLELLGEPTGRYFDLPISELYLILRIVIFCALIF